ncbi:uncharacterized protein LOC101234493 isoform X1 [Hydra vulgaris]|uniref:uncharacterized protein LOC101234493 isoform X1 n=2 Tax=Hydra vulgaris TaxID=6087 RepID=UPI001F5FE142|nr:uncharacterized protein LOC101234493 isoform X1 [Hydra vulgaris]XP_047137139.1 uncharacterized protein LOC101234493 isoform X1 [Hydra vulgaris]
MHGSPSKDLHGSIYESPSKEFGFKTNDVVLTKFGNDIYYAKIVSINYSKKTAMLLFDDGSKENQYFKNIFSVNETTSEIICIVCKKDNPDSEDEIVLCDKCSIGFHQNCHKPKIDSRVLSPDIPWECRFCEQNLKNPYIQSNPFAESNHLEEMNESINAIIVDDKKSDIKKNEKFDDISNANINEKFGEKITIKTEVENTSSSLAYSSPHKSPSYSLPCEDLQKQKRCSKLDEILKDRVHKDGFVPLQCNHHDMLNNNTFEYVYADNSLNHCKHSDLVKSTESHIDLPTKMTAQIQPFPSSTSCLQTFPSKMTAQVSPFSLQMGDYSKNNKTSFLTNNCEKNTSSWLVQQLKRNGNQGNQENYHEDRKPSIIIKEEQNADIPKNLYEPAQNILSQKNSIENCSSAFESRESSLKNREEPLTSERCDVFKPKIIIPNCSSNDFVETASNRNKKYEESTDFYRTQNHPQNQFEFKLQQDMFIEHHRSKTSPFATPKYESLSRSNSESVKSSITLMSQHGTSVDTRQSSMSLSPNEIRNNSYYRDAQKTLMLSPKIHNHNKGDNQNKGVSQLLCSPINSSPLHFEGSSLMNQRYHEALLEQRLAMYDKEIAKLKHQQQLLLAPQNTLVQNMLAKNHAIIEMENQLQLAEAVHLKELMNLRKNVQAMNPIVPQNMHIENLMFSSNSPLNNLSSGSPANLSNPVIMKNPTILNNQLNSGYLRNNHIFFNNESQMNHISLNEMRARNEMLKYFNSHLNEREITALTLAEMRQKELNNLQARSSIHPALLQANMSENLFPSPLSHCLGGLDNNGNQLFQREISNCRSNNALSAWLEKSSRESRASEDNKSLKRFSQEDLNSDFTKKKHSPYRNDLFESEVLRSGEISSSTNHDSNRTYLKQAEATTTPLSRSSNVESFSSPKSFKKQDKRYCHLCKNESQFICSACREAWYCSQKCQLADWKNHSKTCKTNGG